ncbi:hypothetical protein ACFQ6N_16025 [Kitasatospora sp. NPDC056446]|uniref:hypothetical protein n=1 Tax=Kitasatospora sp. NPDC056446 TaxID=3345819 RepID=UPI003678AE82
MIYRPLPQPMLPTDHRIRYYTHDHIRSLLDEVDDRGREFGLIFPTLNTKRTPDDRVLVRFGTAPASTLLNLLTLLLAAERRTR